MKSNPGLNESEVHDFFERHGLLLTAGWVHEHASDDLLEYVGDYKARLDDGWQMHFYFVSTGTASDRQKKLVEELEQKARKEEPGVSFNLIDFSAAKEFYVQAHRRALKQFANSLGRGTHIRKYHPSHQEFALDGVRFADLECRFGGASRQQGTYPTAGLQEER